MINIEQLAWLLINTIEESDKRLGCGDRCSEENDAIKFLKEGLENLPTYATCYTPFTGKESKWNLANYKDDVVSVSIVFLDGQCIAELSNDAGFILTHIDELEPWIRVDSVNTKKDVE